MKSYKLVIYGLILLLFVSFASCIGQDPCENITCGQVCRGEDLWEQKCIGGECVDYRIIKPCSEECGCDLCRGIICEDGCFDYDLWRMKCVDGECEKDYVIEKNSERCGYEPPT